ncbi:uncharacterized protein TRIREDRAFT_109590 [Trichoderma reesei QM6a]|uniref:Predicted protein n=2 Tax=Hypocrea jecorina TaxID=51453 RepID=G0RPM4_HYPJQ|nr:uncharacterized protein TRIREDRAFT_109590 [Trichoderma reesei QM6a]EGR46882.1 predicted protein [Trichoderma reesei QM6a]ETS00467.1 hypothetical protein M419DRAFT_83838 [Trichoderma reesei RUT C-30]
MPQKPELGRRQYQNGRGDDDDDDDDAGDDDGDDDALVGRGSSRVRQTAVQTGSRRPESSASARCPIKYKVPSPSEIRPDRIRYIGLDDADGSRPSACGIRIQTDSDVVGMMTRTRQVKRRRQYYAYGSRSQWGTLMEAMGPFMHAR